MEYISKEFSRLSMFAAYIPLFYSQPVVAQTTCGAAQYQLQSYIAQVNQIANFEYLQGIPQRCNGYSPCMGAWLQQLNVWYQQQSMMVNQWYYQLSVQCAGQTPANGNISPRSYSPQRQSRAEEKVEELELTDDSKTVAIVIPDNPSGFLPQR